MFMLSVWPLAVIGLMLDTRTRSMELLKSFHVHQSPAHTQAAGRNVAVVKARGKFK